MEFGVALKKKLPKITADKKLDIVKNQKIYLFEYFVKEEKSDFSEIKHHFNER